MTDTPEIPKKSTARTQAEIIMQMNKEALRIERRTGASACIVICFFEEGKQTTLQDAGKFPMPPDQFYEIMAQGHRSGQFATKPKSRIIKPN